MMLDLLISIPGVEFLSFSFRHFDNRLIDVEKKQEDSTAQKNYSEEDFEAKS
jgi:hypothetical protein